MNKFNIGDKVVLTKLECISSEFNKETLIETKGYEYQKVNVAILQYVTSKDYVRYVAINPQTGEMFWDVKEEDLELQ